MTRRTLRRFLLAAAVLVALLAGVDVHRSVTSEFLSRDGPYGRERRSTRLDSDHSPFISLPDQLVDLPSQLGLASLVRRASSMKVGLKTLAG
jgi:hypothetical protein